MRTLAYSLPRPIGSISRKATIRPPYAADIGVETLAHLPQAAYGGLIVAFLLIEPMGLGKLYANVRNYLLVWPFGYARK